MSLDTCITREVTASAVAGAWWAPLADFGHTTVVHVDLSARPDREARALALLDDGERARWSEFRYPGPRRRFALCRAALRTILADQLGCPAGRVSFGTADLGKPYCLLGNEPAPVSFNVSHSGSHGLIAFASEGRVGVDVEERLHRRYLDGLIETVLSRAERSEIQGLPQDLRLDSFLRFWTIKEAIIKAIGLGHSLDVAEIETPTSIRRGATTGVFHSPLLPATALHLKDLGNEKFAAALAYEALP